MINDVSYKVLGGYPIKGKIRCNGAKNLVTKVIIASLLSENKTILYNIPSIGDIEITKFFIESLGAIINWDQKSKQIEINPRSITNHEIFALNNSTNRLSILLVVIILQKLKKVSINAVGGDFIGERNINFHTNLIKSFGGRFIATKNRYIGNIKNKFMGSKIKLPYPSVGATESSIFLSVLAKGKSIIDNVAMEPEIIELIDILGFMGAVLVRLPVLW